MLCYNIAWLCFLFGFFYGVNDVRLVRILYPTFKVDVKQSEHKLDFHVINGCNYNNTIQKFAYFFFSFHSTCFACQMVGIVKDIGFDFNIHQLQEAMEEVDRDHNQSLDFFEYMLIIDNIYRKQGKQLKRLNLIMQTID